MPEKQHLQRLGACTGSIGLNPGMLNKWKSDQSFTGIFPNILIRQIYFVVKSHIILRKGFNPFPNKSWFYMSAVKVFKITVENGEIAHDEQFLIFTVFFCPLGKLSAIFINFHFYKI